MANLSKIDLHRLESPCSWHTHHTLLPVPRKAQVQKRSMLLRSMGVGLFESCRGTIPWNSGFESPCRVPPQRGDYVALRNFIQLGHGRCRQQVWAFSLLVCFIIREQDVEGHLVWTCYFAADNWGKVRKIACSYRRLGLQIILSWLADRFHRRLNICYHVVGFQSNSFTYSIKS